MHRCRACHPESRKTARGARATCGLFTPEVGPNWLVRFLASLGMTSSLHIEIPHIQCVVLDELPAWLNHIAHQNREHLVGVDRVIIV